MGKGAWVKEMTIQFTSFDNKNIELWTTTWQSIQVISNMHFNGRRVGRHKGEVVDSFHLNSTDEQAGLLTRILRKTVGYSETRDATSYNYIVVGSQQLRIMGKDLAMEL